MEYDKQLIQWAKRRRKALELVDKGIKRRIVATRLGITRQRLSQIIINEKRKVVG